MMESKKKYNSELIKISDNWELNYIDVDNNWSATASNYGWCYGSGTVNDPYIIENVTISYGSGIKIHNTKEYFIVRKCTIVNIPDMNLHRIDGIYLKNVTNGILLNNNCSLNPGNGIYLENCSNNKVLNNYASFNCDPGIYLSKSSFNNISSNIITDNSGGAEWMGMSLFNSHYNTIFNNSFYSNEEKGIGLYSSNKNSIIYNTIDSSNLELILSIIVIQITLQTILLKIVI